MIFHDYYADVPREAIDRFVQAQELGRLVSVAADGTPHIGLYPFVYSGPTIDLHLVRADEVAVDLAARPRCVFEVDEVLGVIPSYWVHAEYAGSATAYHRTVIFECVARVVEDPQAVATQQAALLARYQPEGGFRPLRADDPLYRGALAQLAAVRLTVAAVRPKFKLGQNRPPDTRRTIIARLRERGRSNDARAADALEATLARDSSTAHVDGPASHRSTPS
ncbi:MAG TPA: FMN-binding negative transcriptional regulator [Methylomirabilota bacterium]|nr:FMN-binding negative transcriptional regulator [Methylomirabilota bacterium]